MEGVVANCSRVQRRMDSWQYGVGSLWWTKLQAYQIVFLDFKYKPSNFVFVEIGTSSRVPITPFMVQHVSKPFSPLRGGTSLEIIPIHV